MSRIAQLRTRLEALALPAMLITRPENCFYLSGFKSSAPTELEVVLVVTGDRQLLITDSRYLLQAEADAPGWTLAPVEERMAITISQVLGTLDVAQIGFEPDALTVDLYQQIGGGDAAVSYSLVPASGLLEAQRLIKDPEELLLIRQAVHVTDLAYAQVVASAKPGVTEEELALEAEWVMRRHGAEGVAFEIIVAAGEHSALPHARSGSRALSHGDLVVVDMGARVAHYCADMTRTFAVGTAKATAAEIYRLCYTAQTTGARQIRAGMSGREADSIVRSVIERGGYGSYFGHGTGHGVGLAIHEAPRLSRFADAQLPVGAIITIEPGIYLPGVGGVRIEDLCVLTANGVEILSESPKPAELPVYC